MVAGQISVLQFEVIVKLRVITHDWPRSPCIDLVAEQQIGWQNNINISFASPFFASPVTHSHASPICLSIRR
jgi:hypothetical protein